MSPLVLLLALLQPTAQAEEAGVDQEVAELTDVEGGCAVTHWGVFEDGATVMTRVEPGITCATYEATLSGAIIEPDDNDNQESYYRAEITGVSPLDGDVDWLWIDVIQDGEIALLVTEEEDEINEIVHHTEEGWVEVNGVAADTTDPGNEVELTEEGAAAAELLRDLVGDDFDELLDPLI